MAFCVHRLGNVLTEETEPFFKHQFNESAPCRKYIWGDMLPIVSIRPGQKLTNSFGPTLLRITAVGCHRTRVGDARVKTCEPVTDWRKLVDMSHTADDRVGSHATPKTPLHVEL